MSPIFSPLGARLWCAGLAWAGLGWAGLGGDRFCVTTNTAAPCRGRGRGGESSKVSGYFLA